MPEKKVASIVIVNLPKSLNCFLGGRGVDPSGGQICAIYDDGSFEKLRMDQDGVVITCNTDSEGATLAQVSYGGQSQLFQVYVRKPVIRRFILSALPEKKEYLAGEKLDLTGLKLVAEYETGEREPFDNIPAVDYTVQYGDAVYPLSINGLSVPIYIKVMDATMTGIRMGKLPTKLEYLERKDKFDPAGGTIIEMYDSGMEKEVPLPYSAVRGFSNLNPGPLELTVQIGKHSTSFQVIIKKKQAVRVVIDTLPFRTSYTEGESLVLDGARISVEYNNGESHICDEWDYEPKKAIMGQELIKIMVEDAAAVFPIVVVPRQLMSIRVCKLPDKTKYKERLEQLKIDGAELELDYDYGEPKIIPIETYMVKGFDNRRAGECKVEVQYQGLVAEFSVDILPQTLLGITITQMPEKVDYAPGENFDPKGMVVSGFYDSGVLEPLRSYAITPDRPLQEGDVAILVASVDKTAVVPIKVAEMFRAKDTDPKPWDFDSQSHISPGSSESTLESGGDPAGVIPGGSLFGSRVQGATNPNPGLGFMPMEDGKTSLFAPAAEPEPEPDGKKKSGFWGKKLFGPNTAKYRGED